MVPAPPPSPGRRCRWIAATLVVTLIVGSLGVAIVLGLHGHKDITALTVEADAVREGGGPLPYHAGGGGGEGSNEVPTTTATSSMPAGTGDGLTFRPAGSSKPPPPALLPSLTLPTGGSRDKQQQQTNEDSSPCLATDTASLTAAVASLACASIRLTNPDREAYVLSEELLIDRPVAIYGHPLSLPTIDAGRYRVPTHPPTHLPTYLCIHPPASASTHPPIHPPTHPPTSPTQTHRRRPGHTCVSRGGRRLS